jgi:hypothetical protein
MWRGVARMDEVSRAVYRALALMAAGAGRSSPEGVACNVNRARCPQLHRDGHVEADIWVEDPSADPARTDGSPWATARWDASPSNPKATAEARPFWAAFQALTEAGIRGDPIMRSEDGARMIVRLPAHAASILANVLGTRASSLMGGVSQAGVVSRDAAPTVVQRAPEVPPPLVSPARSRAPGERERRHTLRFELDVSEPELRELVRRAELQGIPISAVVAETVRESLRHEAVRRDRPEANRATGAVRRTSAATPKAKATARRTLAVRPPRATAKDASSGSRTELLIRAIEALGRGEGRVLPQTVWRQLDWSRGFTAARPDDREGTVAVIVERRSPVPVHPEVRADGRRRGPSWSKVWNSMITNRLRPKGVSYDPELARRIGWVRQLRMPLVADHDGTVYVVVSRALLRKTARA